MARPTVIRDEAIVEAAREVFLSRGFQATTAEVAERAGVSEGSIFKRFKSKVELFQAAMRPQIEEPSFVRGLDERVGRGDVGETMVAIGVEAVAFFRSIAPLMMMGFSNPDAAGKPCTHGEPNPPALRTLRKLATYFDAEMRIGRLGRHDPDILARVLVGSVHNFVVFQMLFQPQDQTPMPADEYVRGLVHLLLVGAGPTERGSSR